MGASSQQGSTRVLRLRYRAKCAVCFRSLAPGTRAEWNTRRKLAICLPCTAARPKANLLASIAGASARSQAEGRRRSQQARLRAERAARPVLGRLRQGLFPEVDAGAAWERGAVGEELLAASLHPLVVGGQIEALHDRRIPGSTANIDHLVVAASGIWVIDAKRFRGKISKGMRGGMLSSRSVVTVGGRDRTNLVDGVRRQVGTVRTVLAEFSFDPLPVRSALCFVDGDWGLRFRPFSVDGVLVIRPSALRSRLRAPGSLDADQRGQLSAFLAAAFPSFT